MQRLITEDKNSPIVSLLEEQVTLCHINPFDYEWDWLFHRKGDELKGVMVEVSDFHTRSALTELLEAGAIPVRVVYEFTKPYTPGTPIKVQKLVRLGN